MGVLDAWAYGLSVITTPVGGIPDVAIDGKNCMLFSPGDIYGLASKMDVLMNDECLRQKIETESLKLARSFSIDNITSKLSRIYDDLMKK